MLLCVHVYSYTVMRWEWSEVVWWQRELGDGGAHQYIQRSERESKRERERERGEREREYCQAFSCGLQLTSVSVSTIATALSTDTSIFSFVSCDHFTCWLPNISFISFTALQQTKVMPTLREVYVCVCVCVCSKKKTFPNFSEKVVSFFLFLLSSFTSMAAEWAQTISGHNESVRDNKIKRKWTCNC